MKMSAAHNGPLAPRVGVSAVSHPAEVGADRTPKAASNFAELLAGAGCEVVQIEPVDGWEKAAAVGRKLAESHVDAVALASATWFESFLVVDLLEECRAPVLIWSLPGMETGALCGTQQLTCYLKQLGWPYECVYGAMDDAECLHRSVIFLRAAALARRMRRARIGVAGHRVTGMTDVAVNEIALKRSIGAQVVPLDLPQLLARADEIPDTQAEAMWRQVVEGSGRCNVSDEVGLDSMRIHAAISELVREYGLDALAIGCYPHLMGRVCLAASLLADKGIPLACEGDVNGAVAQLALVLLTGEPTHNTDWLEPLEDGTVVFSHCGSGSFSLAESREDITLDSVRLMGSGVCALFPARPGPVTLVNLVPSGDGYQCALLEGEALPAEMVFPGNPVRVRFAQPTGELIDWIHSEGVGHHWMIGYGHVGGEIRACARIAGDGLNLIEPA